MLLDEAIRKQASQLTVHPYLGGTRIRVRLFIAGNWRLRAMLSTDCWPQFLEAIKRRSGIDPSSTTWPQQGQFQWQNAAFSVTITRPKKHETVLIDIPPTAAGTLGPSDPANPPDKDRTRSWT